LFNNAVDWKCRSGSAQLDCRFVFESSLPPEAVLSAGFADGSSWGEHKNLWGDVAGAAEGR
jgi:hypothetical protein